MPVGPGTTHPFPALQNWAGSNLQFPWAFATEHLQGRSVGAFGPDGVIWHEVMYVRWEDLAAAVQALVGYSYRDVTANRYPRQGWTPITGCTNAGVAIQITSANHGLQVNDPVVIRNVLGNLSANGVVGGGKTQFVVAVVDANNFTVGPLGGPANPGSGTYVTGTGEWRTAGSVLRRKLPWQHPQFNQLWVRRISQVHGIIPQGNSALIQLVGIAPDVGLGGAGGGNAGAVGPGQPPNTGPFSQFQMAMLTLEFWRPPYMVRSDADVTVAGVPREWLRYTDTEWKSQTQILSREQTSWQYTDTNLPVPGGIGQKITHHKVSKTWHEIPAGGIFLPSQDQTAQGEPANLLYTQTVTVNPITNFQMPGGWPIGGCVNVPIGGGRDDSNAANRLFGSIMGTLLFEDYVLKPRPLQLPANLMQILQLNNEPLAQQQYDIELLFDKFDPPPGTQGTTFATLFGAPTTIALRGHNLLPRTGDGLWYPVQSALTVKDAGGANRKTTPFLYSDLTDIWQIV